MTQHKVTNAASSGIVLDKKTLKSLMRRSDIPGLRWLFLWVMALAITGFGVWYTLDSFWVWPAMFIYGTVLSVPAYAISHETAHGTAFRSRWLNELVFWFSSLIYFEEPTHRRYAHARHHSYTWINGMDAQMPFSTPMTLKGWFWEITGLHYYVHGIKLFIRHAFGAFDKDVRDFTPKSELTKLQYGAIAFILIYLFIVLTALYYQQDWPLYFILLPRLLGAPSMLFYTLIQHVEMMEDQYDICQSTRSFETNAFSRFLYMNMNFHREHHLWPTVPFHKLPALNGLVKDQLPTPDQGLLKTNIEVFAIILRRSLFNGKMDKAAVSAKE